MASLWYPLPFGTSLFLALKRTHPLDNILSLIHPGFFFFIFLVGFPFSLNRPMQWMMCVGAHSEEITCTGYSSSVFLGWKIKEIMHRFACRSLVHASMTRMSGLVLYLFFSLSICFRLRVRIAGAYSIK